MSERYPTRPRFFANKYCRLLAKSAAAQELGPEVCWLLTVIALQEDAKIYTSAVTFYNEQLMPLLGIGGRTRLVRARNKAVESKWLYYEQGAKGVPGKYWVTIPPEYQTLSDRSIDESDTVPIRDDKQDGKQNSVPIQDGNQDGNQDGKCAPYKPIPNTKEERSSDDDRPSRKKHQYSQPFENWWKLYPLITGKRKASLAYKRAAAEVGHEALLLAVKAFAASDKGRGQYCPHAATWLNEGRYEDDPTAWQDRNGNGKAHGPTLPEGKPA